MTTKQATLTHMQSEYSVVDVSDNSTTVYTGQALLYGVYVNTVLSAHALPIKDGTTTVVTLPASMTVGEYIVLPGVRFDTSLIVDPDDSATGSVTVVFRSVNPSFVDGLTAITP
jgi:hypothetical protein